MPRHKLKKSKIETLDDLKKKIVGYLSKGLNLKDACILAECNSTNLIKLRNDPDFDRLVKLARVRNKEDYITIVKDSAMDGNVEVAKWWLERQHPASFGKKDRHIHEHTVKIQILQKVLVTAINEELADYPQLKYRIINRLRNFEYDSESEEDVIDLKQIEHLPNNYTTDEDEDDE